jgi:hypothetical protein
MIKPKGYKEGDDFVNNVVLDSNGNKLVVAAARKVGKCSTCSKTGKQVIGFQATVVGTLDAGATPIVKPGSTKKPPVLRVTQVLPISTPCPKPSTRQLSTTVHLRHQRSDNDNQT